MSDLAPRLMLAAYALAPAITVVLLWATGKFKDSDRYRADRPFLDARRKRWEDITKE